MGKINVGHQVNLGERRNIYIPLDDIDWIWDEDELEAFRHMWAAGRSIEQIAKYFKRKDIDEIVVVVLDQARKDKIKPREGGVFS
ncbi:hypothetical protein [Halalkalibacter krulwichiae]|uniref:Helix-turn-helix domain containing protein n=1 Tax=Halalkalibacter krulwichiae TaxID=199441 RepID=A0A1X9M9B6_9BACI|nr:hypothetical protein [Halalkalibacter krulwichiae]ARK28763.1 hypothetical protein BkAM31D_02250 [Halalkalibacter krulwichiae]